MIISATALARRASHAATPFVGNPFFYVSGAFPCDIPLRQAFRRQTLGDCLSGTASGDRLGDSLSGSASRESLWTDSQGGILDSWGRTTLGSILPESLGVTRMTFFRLFFWLP